MFTGRNGILSFLLLILPSAVVIALILVGPRKCLKQITGEGPAPLLYFWAENNFFLGWVPPSPFSQGLNDRTPTSTPPYLKVLL